MSAQPSIVVMISGNGSNLQALIDNRASGNFAISAVVCNEPGAFGLERAARAGIPTVLLNHRDFPNREEFDQALISRIDDFSPDLLVLAGYMRILSSAFVQHYEGRILNIHPSLLPLFPGLHTHQRAIDTGMKIAGCTVHFVTEGMDEGPIIAQAAVPVLAQDTAETLAARLLTVEHQLYPLALKLVAEGKVRMENGRAMTSPGPSDGLGEQTLLSGGL